MSVKTHACVRDTQIPSQTHQRSSFISLADSSRTRLTLQPVMVMNICWQRQRWRRRHASGFLNQPPPPSTQPSYPTFRLDTQTQPANRPETTKHTHTQEGNNRFSRRRRRPTTDAVDRRSFDASRWLYGRCWRLFFFFIDVVK